MCNHSIEMLPAVYAKDGSLKHSTQCQMSFGRKDERCPRCVEMLNGAPARGGWQQRYYSQKKLEEERAILSIRNHDCKKSNCGHVCTHGDW